MIYLWCAYLVLFLGIALYSFIDQRKERTPLALAGLGLLADVVLAAGVVLNIMPTLAPAAKPPWALLVFPLLLCEFVFMGYDVKNEEHELSDSAKSRRMLDAATLTFLMLLLAPGVYHNVSFAYPGRGYMFFVAGAVAVVGTAVGLLLPRLRSRYASSNQRKLANWVEASTEFEGFPNQVLLLDNRPRTWPGTDFEMPTQLFTVQCGQAWHVGVTLEDDVAFCLKEPVSPDISPDDAFSRCQDWFASQVATDMIKDAAKSYPEEFQKLISEALDNAQADRPDGGE